MSLKEMYDSLRAFENALKRASPEFNEMLKGNEKSMTDDCPPLTQAEEIRLVSLPGLIVASEQQTSSLKLERITLTDIYNKNKINSMANKVL